MARLVKRREFSLQAALARVRKLNGHRHDGNTDVARAAVGPADSPKSKRAPKTKGGDSLSLGMERVCYRKLQPAEAQFLRDVYHVDSADRPDDATDDDDDTAAATVSFVASVPSPITASTEFGVHLLSAGAATLLARLQQRMKGGGKNRAIDCVTAADALGRKGHSPGALVHAGVRVFSSVADNDEDKDEEEEEDDDDDGRVPGSDEIAFIVDADGAAALLPFLGSSNRGGDEEAGLAEEDSAIDLFCPKILVGETDFRFLLHAARTAAGDMESCNDDDGEDKEDSEEEACGVGLIVD